MSCNWNEYNLKPLARIHWRASLLPATMVIPAPIVYNKAVAVKKLIVGFWALALPVCLEVCPTGGVAPSCLTKTACALNWVCARSATFTLKKLECSKQASPLGYISME